jgi:hypothetical protein
VQGKGQGGEGRRRRADRREEGKRESQVTKRDGEARKLECVAYHEAGHAVMSLAMRWKLLSITVVPHQNTLGSCRNKPPPSIFQPDGNSDWQTLARVEREIMIFLGGVAAEQILRGLADWKISADADMERAFDLAVYVCGDEKEISAFLQWLHRRTLNLLGLDHHWRAVEGIAEALIEHKTVSGRRARQLFQAALADGLTAKRN